MRFALHIGAVLAAVLLALPPGAVRAVEPARACPVADELVPDAPRLEATAAKLKAKQPLTIVAIGGASTAGTAAGDGEAYAYPQALASALKARHPETAITVLNKGVPRQTTVDMIARFPADVVAEGPTLVLWETGTVDAVRGVDVDDFAAALQDGIDALRQHNFDIVLIDMQYNPSTGSVIDFGPYLEAMRNAADLEHVYLFRRYEIMRTWSENSIFDFVDVPKGDRTALARAVYRCLGDALGEAIDRATE